MAKKDLPEQAQADNPKEHPYPSAQAAHFGMLEAQGMIRVLKLAIDNYLPDEGFDFTTTLDVILAKLEAPAMFCDGALCNGLDINRGAA